MTGKNILRAFAIITALIAATSAIGQQTNAQKPAIWRDYDEANITEPAAPYSGYYYDFIDGTVFQQVKQSFDVPRLARKLAGQPKQALNINSEGGVPDSSWFTNRNGRRSMSIGEIERGPNQDAGPAGERFTVLRAKTVGVTPGLWIKDERGRTYIVKFDPKDYPELNTAAEVIATKVFYAIGYNVPENTIFRFRREQLKLDKDATYRDRAGRQQSLTDEIVDSILESVAQEPSGAFRTVASKFLPGKPKGGFAFHGVREDDPNDIIPHEHRRDVRALRVFSAWLEHNDIRLGNTLDIYAEEGGRHFLRHYLIDFGSTLGSATNFPNPPHVGDANIVDLREAGVTLLTLGLKQPTWSKGEAILYPSVGRYSGDNFNPRKWKSDFPLVAFGNMTEEDARWAAEIVGSFTNQQIWAAVTAGQLSDSRASEYLAAQIISRRDKIVAAYIDSDRQRTLQLAEVSKFQNQGEDHAR